MLSRFSKRGRYWKAANLNYVKSLSKQTASFDPFCLSISHTAVLCSEELVSAYFKAGQPELELIQVDFMDVSKPQFKLIHKTNIWALVAIFALVNPRLKKRAFDHVIDWKGITNRQSQMVNKMMAKTGLDYSLLSPFIFSAITDVVCAESLKQVMHPLFPMKFGLWANNYLKVAKESFEQLQQLTTN